jgi:vanillate monooxygenase
MFPKNTWYVGAMPSELDGKPLGRKICGESIVFFRGPDNKVAAVEDFCPHRGAPLSLGKVENGKLVCGYHGLEMGCDGKTVAMPCQRVGGFPAVRTYPVVERYGFIWVWPGDAQQADPSKIHHLAWADDPEWAYSGGLYHVKCDYRLMIDNLMDLTHETYLHPTTIGQKEIDESPPKTRIDGDCAITERYMEGIMAPPFWRAGLRGNNLADDVPVDRWQICRFYPPSHVLIDVGVAHAGKGGFDADPKVKASSTVIDFITPETESSTWYFWGMARNFNAQDRALSEQIRTSLSKVFSEDLQMLEMQQQNLERNAGRKLLSLNIDGGGVQARRIIDRWLAAEQAAA